MSAVLARGRGNSVAFGELHPLPQAWRPAGLEAANRRLVEADRARSRFVMEVSHQLRSQLGTVKNCLAVVREGHAASRKMRKEPAWSRVPILMLTGMREQIGFSFPGEAKDPVFLPVDEFMEKPIESAQLVEKVARLIGAP